MQGSFVNGKPVLQRERNGRQTKAPGIILPERVTENLAVEKLACFLDLLSLGI